VSVQIEIEAVDSMPAGALMRLSEMASQVLRRLGIDSTLTILVAADDVVQEMNARYRGIDAPTDVLAFPAGPLPPEVAETPYLGDLILAYHHTIAQAQQYGHPPADEFALLVVHGILHLAGYDHDTPETQRQMWQKQTELLSAIGVDMIVPDYVHE
jgi:probable rRNA maturation factor